MKLKSHCNILTLFKICQQKKYIVQPQLTAPVKKETSLIC